MVKLLVIDNYDSFTYNLVAYCQELGAHTEVVYNDKITIEDINLLNPDKILLSPGPGSPNDSGICLDVLKYCHKTKPILGVCLGHQCIGQYFGGEVIHAQKVMHGKTSIVQHNNSKLFKNIQNNFNVGRYHSLLINPNNFPECLNITAICEDRESDKEIMAVEHKEYAVYGVQFHPESVLSECGHELLKNFLVTDS